MEKKDLKKLTKGQLIKLLLKNMRTCLTTTHLRMKVHKSQQNQLHHRELENGKAFHARVLMKTSYYHHQIGTSLFQNQELTDHLKYKMHEDHRNQLENHHQSLKLKSI